MTRRVKLGTFVALGLALAVVLAFVVAPEASSKPDGLEKVAGDEGFLEGADDHDLAGSPTADYGVEGVDDERLATGISGVIGIAITFVVAGGLTLGARRLARRTDRPPADAPAAG